MENICVQVADDTIGKNLLGEIIAAHISQDLDSEELKIRILEAVSAKVGEDQPEGDQG